MVRLTACIYLLLVFQGCGKQKFPDYSDQPDQREEQEAGYYTGRFTSFNSSRVGSVNAHAVLWTKGQQFYARVVMMKGAKSVIYQQYVHKGSSCPTSRSDLNHDGVIDINEVAVASGPMLIPLDRNLKTQARGSEWFPRTDKEGIYYYSRAGDISDMMSDLRRPDQAPGRGLAKLDKNENLDLERRTIVLYLSSIDMFMPVACAELDEDFSGEYE